MKIKKIELNNYKAFYKTHTIDVGGKNLFIYGENGSGKSSLYYGLKDFFQSSRETIDFDEVENIFLPKSEKGNGYVKVTFNPDKDGIRVDKTYEFSKANTNTFSATDTSIRDAISLKSFLTYKHLLGIHNIKKGDQIDLFDLLVKGVLKHFKSAAITGTKELGELWQDVINACNKPTIIRTYTLANKRTDIQNALRDFNNAFRQLFTSGSPENIVNFSKPILDEFHHNIEISLNYTEAIPNANLDGVERNHVRISLKYLGKVIPEPHLFLNEARLSAIAISIYLGMIKRHPQLTIKSKILFLDDIFIGLDIANRLPLIEILNNHFADYQIIITTYDKPWYEFMKFYLNDNRDWQTVELYARRSRMGFEIPMVRQQSNSNYIQNMINIGETYFNAGDNKAAGVYLRAAFEFMLKKYCEKKFITVKYQPDSSKLTSSDFWIEVKKFRSVHGGTARCLITAATETDIDHSIKLTLNPLSHHDMNKHEFSSEINSAISRLRTLQTELGV